MGRIKQSIIKDTAFELLKRYGKLFTDNYEENKKIVKMLIKVDGSATVNKIAGYVTRLKKQGRNSFF